MERAEFAGHEDFVRALHALVQEARERRLRRLVFIDPSFEDWPLESTVLLGTLTAFVREPGRCVLLFGRGFAQLRRRSPRLVAWRRTWSHAVQAARPSDPDTELPTRVLADRALALSVSERATWAGTVRIDEPEVVRWALEADALTQRSVPDFAADVLGL